MDDRQEFLRQFLLYGHVLTHEEIEAAGDEGVPLSSPTLEQFKEHIDTYENIYTVVEKFKVRIYIYICQTSALVKMGSCSSTTMCQYWDNHLIY